MVYGKRKVPLARILPGVLAALLVYGAPLFPEAGYSVAQAQEEDSKAPMKGKKTQALGKKVYETERKKRRAKVDKRTTKKLTKMERKMQRAQG